VHYGRLKSLVWPKTHQLRNMGYIMILYEYTYSKQL